jgi:hypothetical protein
MTSSWFMYVLECVDGSMYCGVTHRPCGPPALLNSGLMALGDQGRDVLPICAPRVTFSRDG